jgi:ribonuclease R
LGANLGGGAAAKARAGDLVLIQASARGARGARGAGQPRVTRVIGRPDVARDVIEGLMLDRGLARGFHAEVQREAAQARDRGLDGSRGAQGRRDLRALPTFTIDPSSARDFDDAISAEALEGGGVRVWVHIADVSAYAPPGSLVDREARRRSTSVYVPGAVEPMLPEALSNDACSLVPGRDRLAVTVELELNGAKLVRSAFYRSLICSDERLDYERVDRIFAGTESAAEPWGEPLRAARIAARALGEERARRGGALTLDSPEPEFSFDEQGHLSSATSSAGMTESHRLIEHLMIAANEAVASLLAQRGVPGLYRVHERPEVERVERLVAQLVSLGVPTPPVPPQMSRTQAAELLGDISRRVERHVQGVARRAREGDRGASPSGGRLALTSLVLRSLKQAYYSPKNLGHAGLGSACYCHFTSPIRRYPDLVCHRALLAAVGGGEQPPRAGGLGELGEWTSEREREAMKIERDADDVASCFLLERELYEQGWERTFQGEVTGLIAAGAFIAFTADHDGAGRAGSDSEAAQTRGPAYEGMLPVRRMRGAGASGSRSWWELNEHGTILHGERVGETLRLGDPIAVRVRRVETARGRVDLGPSEG